MRRKWIIAIAAGIAAVVATAGIVVDNKLSSFRRDVSDIQFRLGDLENALRGAPNADTLATVRRRLDVMRDDLRLLLTRHGFAITFYRDETRAVWNRFNQVEQRSRALAR
jgi:hypothetical protein